MTCPECRDLLPALWERTLRDEARTGVEAHVSACQDCRREYADLCRAMTALTHGAPFGAEVGPAFTQAVMRRVRADRATPRASAWRAWGLLAAAALLVAAALRATLDILPVPHGTFPRGPVPDVRVFHHLAERGEPYRPGDPLLPGDIVVVAPRPVARSRGEDAPQPVWILADRDGVQIVSGASGIAWKETPALRRRRLHQLVDMAEGGDEAAAGLAREELQRILGQPGPDGLDAWRLALAHRGAAPGASGQEGSDVLPAVEDGARIFSNADHSEHMTRVSQAFFRTAALVRDAYLPEPLAKPLGMIPETEL